MKTYFIAICILAVAAPKAFAADTIEYPTRKPGLWELQTTGAPGQPAQTMKQCIDAESDAKLMKMATEMASKMAKCSKNTFQKQGAQYVGESECIMMGTKMTSKSVFGGDFNAAYKGDVTTKFDPPMMGMSESKSTITAKWLSVCDGTMKPGDIILPTGQKMNVDDIAKMGAGMATMGGAASPH